MAMDVLLKHHPDRLGAVGAVPVEASSAALEISERIARLTKRLSQHHAMLLAVHGRAFGSEPMTGEDQVRPTAGPGVMHQIADELASVEDLLSRCENAAGELYRIV
jgi:hypothetical protein